MKRSDKERYSPSPPFSSPSLPPFTLFLPSLSSSVFCLSLYLSNFFNHISPSPFSPNTLSTTTLQHPLASQHSHSSHICSHISISIPHILHTLSFSRSQSISPPFSLLPT